MKRAATGAAAGGGRAAPGKRVAAALPLSDNFQAGDADLEIHSSDGIAFRVHKANLLASSKTFADMFDSIPEPAEAEGLPTIELTEPASVLERILPYCYPNAVEPWDLDLPQGDLDLLGALDKYEIWRGIEAVQAAMLVLLRIDHDAATGDYVWFGVETSLVCHAFAKHFKLPALIPITKMALAESVTEAASRSMLKMSTLLDGTDLGALGSHLHRDTMVLQLLNFVFELVEERDALKAQLLLLVKSGAADCGGRDAEVVRNEWDSLRTYGSRQGLYRWTLDFDGSVCGTCREEFKLKREELAVLADTLLARPDNF